ncbi:anti-sigma-28 factor [Isoalcanivorax pacificus W11-5]|uniref:Negative regulator of flagellin synthesis n=1 Tax=Isoalcanivorax pacificus W11-5 TaxID=391936 RepID=A0A0B4XSH9_9GAMM|nr:flagellar biosynthesis anti-sigma factor FlgM [Isoalcanivorax pacificus]AJD49378.1 anti-sigma-28 factor [Isoalcanivorax pacificus W11-5]
MKIDKLTPLTSPGSLAPGKQTDRSAGAGDASAGSSAAVTHLRHQGSSDQDINTARVEEIRQAISEGRLEIRTDQIADALIASVRDLLGRS